MKKYIAEMFGTMVLVLMGCGTAISLSSVSYTHLDVYKRQVLFWL